MNEDEDRDQDALDDDDRVVLVGEDGEETTFAILAVVEFEELDYALLAPEAQVVDDDGEVLELFIFRFEEDEEGTQRFSPVENDETYERVQTFCLALLESDEE